MKTFHLVGIRHDGVSELVLGAEAGFSAQKDALKQSRRLGIDPRYRCLQLCEVVEKSVLKKQVANIQVEPAEAVSRRRK